jgi:hypothetical protein
VLKVNRLKENPFAIIYDVFLPINSTVLGSISLINYASKKITVKLDSILFVAPDAA